MRVTNKMMTDMSASNLSSSVNRLLWLQNQMSTGRRINRPSDDPVGLTRDLSYRTTISTIEQYQGNIAAATTQMNTVEQSLGSVSSLLISARELATALADGTYDETARKGAAVEARSLLDQMLQAGNTQSEGRYLFSGHQTRNQTFLSTPTGIVYQGDRGIIYSQVETSSQVAVNLVGSDVMIGNLRTLGEDADLNRGVTSGLLLSDLHQGTGVNLGLGSIRFVDTNLSSSVAVDISGATTIGDVVNAINAQLPAGGMNGVTAQVSPDGQSLRLVAQDNGLIANATRLANLNGGAAVDLVPGTIHVATDDGSIDVAVDLSGATTIGAAIAAFNSQMASAGVNNVTLSINPAQTGLRITDANASPLGLKVEDPSGGSTAHDLGIVGYVNDELIGGDLNPQREITVTENGPGETVAIDLGILGSFTRTKDGADLDPILSATTALTELNNAKGLSLGSIRLSQGDRYKTVNLSGATTLSDVINIINTSGLNVQASLNASGKGIQIVPTTDDRTLTVTNEDSTNSAGKLGIEGSPDLLGTMMLLVDALENNDQDMVGGLIGSLEKATDHILDYRASIGANIRRLDATTSRLDDLSLSINRLLSSVEDADIIKVTTELATQQNVYQSALNAVARVLQPSLVDFVQ